MSTQNLNVEMPVVFTKIALKLTAEATSYTEIPNLESITINIDKTMEDWTTFSDNGATKHLVTGDDFSVDCTAKHLWANEVHKAIVAMAHAIGSDCVKPTEITYADGSKYQFQGVYSVSNYAGGDAGGLDTLEFTCSRSGSGVLVPAV